MLLCTVPQPSLLIFSLSLFPYQLVYRPESYQSVSSTCLPSSLLTCLSASQSLCLLTFIKTATLRLLFYFRQVKRPSVGRLSTAVTTRYCARAIPTSSSRSSRRTTSCRNPFCSLSTPRIWMCRFPATLPPPPPTLADLAVEPPVGIPPCMEAPERLSNRSISEGTAH